MSEELQGLEFLKKNEIKEMTCKMGQPFAFISYSHDEHDAQIVMNVFKKLREKEYNLWIDTANMPVNEDSWKDSARKALRSPCCKLAIYFRSESSMVKETIATELELIKNLDHIGPIITVDIWVNQNYSADAYWKYVINNGTEMENKCCAKICEIVEKDNKAIRLASDLSNDVNSLVDEIAEELDSRGVESSKGKTISEKHADAEPVSVPKEEETKENLLYYKGAVGKPDGLGGIVILKNSKISKEEVVSCPEGAKKKRREAKERNLLVGEGTYYILQEDMHFKSLSGAAYFVSGTSVNGKQVWKSQQGTIAELGTKESAEREKGIRSKINQICMVIQKVKEEKKPIYDYSRLLQKTYANVAEELNIEKSSVVDKCQRQLGLRAEEFTRYVKEYFDSESDTLYKIVFDATKSQEEKELVNRTFDK